MVLTVHREGQWLSLIIELEKLQNNLPDLISADIQICDLTA